MKTTFVNNTTKQEVGVFDLFVLENGQVQSDGKRGERFLKKYEYLLREVAHAEDGSSIFEPVEGWSVLNGSRKRGTQKPQQPKPRKKSEKPQPQPTEKAEAENVPTVFFTVNGETFRNGDRVTIETVDAYDAHHTAEVGTLTGYSSTQALAEVTTDNGEKVYGHFATVKHSPAEAVEVVGEESNEETAHKPENVHTTEESTKDEQALIAAIKNLRGGAIDAGKVEEIVLNVLNRMAKEDHKKVSAVVKKARQNAKKDGEVYCEKFERIVAKVARGNNVYLYGRAGSGKSHTAEQVAERLGLDFYGQTTIQFAHDVRGYGDAGGNYQETPFFKAFAHGGLYFQDEYDRSNSEAAIVLNSALANGWYDFPIVGRVNAHPDFRFMAAGNTLMKGADEEYVTGQIIDASCRDRFCCFFEVDYNHTVEMKIAGGNEEIVAFVEDIREAIKATGIQQVVSYRATAAMRDEVENENDKEACIIESVCKGLEKDEIREIYGALKNKDNVWAKAMKKAF